MPRVRLTERERNGRKAWARGKAPLSSYMYGTAINHAIRNHSRAFLESFPSNVLKGKKRSKYVLTARRSGNSVFESEAQVNLEQKKIEDGKLQNYRILFSAGLGFNRGEVIIEVLQGRYFAQGYLDRFRQMHGKFPANYLVETIEEHARNLGFKRVKLRVPESLRGYHYPADSRVEIQVAVRKRMIALYEAVAKARGFKRKGNFFVKSLR